MSVKPDDPFWGFRHPPIGEGGWREWFEPSGVYVIAAKNADRPVKIGVTANVAARIKAFEAGNPHGLRALSYHPIGRGVALQVERRIHDLFKRKALGREWFDLSAEEAAEPIPEMCRIGHLALEAYKQDILTDQAKLLNAAERQEQARRVNAAFVRARLTVAHDIHKARAMRGAQKQS